MPRPDLSFVVAVLNERGYIESTLQSLAVQELDGRTAEVLVLDGGSTDGSIEIIERFAAGTGPVRFRLIHNPRRRTPAAFNIGIAEARADIIGFGGAHTIYPAKYFLNAIERLSAKVAEVVGGGHNSHVPSVRSAIGRAMACLYLSPMGSGVAAYHRRTEPGFVDTVYGGFYLRRVFDRIGRFNETLTRNQDNELNARVLAAGMRIYFDPALSTEYVLKADLRTFLKRGFLFGRYHPETWMNTPSAFRLRHAIPGAFAAYVVIAVASSLAFGFQWWVFVPLALYLLLLLAAAARLARAHSVAVAALTVPLFVSYHLSYGMGTLVGLVHEGVSTVRPAENVAAS